MLNTFGSSYFLFALVFLNACAKVNTYNANSEGNVIQHGSGLAQVAVSSDSLQGSWGTLCTSPSKESHYKTTISFQNDVMTTTTDSFADPDCKFKITKETRYSNFVQDETSDNLSRLKESLKMIQYTPLNDAMTSVFNRSKFCGVASWATGVLTSFTDGSKCGVTDSLAYHVEIYGAKELYLDDCLTPGQANCSSIRYLKTAGLSK